MTDKNEFYHKASEDVTQKGAVEFGGNWLTANERAVLMAVKLGVDYTNPQTKALMQCICLHVLRLGKKIYAPKPSPKPPRKEGE